ncbi:MAG: acyl-CoA dehydrogenase family protein [Dehalococcoidia bacterium]
MQSLVSYALSEEQAALRDAVRSFVDREVLPAAMERERIADAADRVPWGWIETLSKMGVRTMPVPEEFGGAGADVLTTCIIGEELAAGDLGLAVIFDQTWKFIPLITTACSPGQRERYLPPFLADDRFLLALGLHEDGAGSDHFLPYNVAPHGGRATAVQQPDGSWLLNGAKTYISNGGLARLHVIFARTRPGSGGVDGQSAFFVEEGTPGFSIGRIEDKVGRSLAERRLISMTAVCPATACSANSSRHAHAGPRDPWPRDADRGNLPRRRPRRLRCRACARRTHIPGRHEILQPRHHQT